MFVEEDKASELESSKKSDQIGNKDKHRTPDQEGEDAEGEHSDTNTVTSVNSKDAHFQVSDEKWNIVLGNPISSIFININF